MRGVRLNGWQRIGIVLSVLWAAFVLFYIWQNWATLSSVYSDQFYRCLFGPDEAADFKTCHANYYAAMIRVVGSWLAPIPIAWMVIYLIVWTVRWIRRGFQPST
jgi:hypothetical protein